MRTDVVLVSNASMDLYPGNKLSEFRVRLPHALMFDKNYRVAVTRISFTKSYFNYDIKKGERYWNIIHSSSKADYEPIDLDSRNKCRLMVQPLAGYYTPQTFCDMINECVSNFKIDGVDKLKTKPRYSLKNGYLYCQPGTYLNAAGVEIMWEVKFDIFTKEILGTSKDPARPVFLNQGWTDLYVYSDLVYPTVVGDKTVELLCIADGQTGKEFGAHCSEVFEDAWYHPLAKHNFQEIKVYLRNDQGKAPRFLFGRVTLRLSFRREDDL